MQQAVTLPALRASWGFESLPTHEDVAEWRGAGLQSPLTLVQLQSSSLWP